MTQKMPPKARKEIDLMLKLSFLAYAGCYRICRTNVNRAVRQMVEKFAPTQSMAWGPVSSGNLLDLFTTTLAYITKDEEAARRGEAIYTVVIRGTNALSWTSAVFQDLAAHRMTPWKLVSPHARISPKADPSIYVGASRTLDDLNALKHKGVTMVEFLEDKARWENAKIRVTGHSLGGMAAMMYPVWLQDEFIERDINIAGRFSAFPIAGLTPGNRDFADYTEQLFAKHRNSYLRIVNNLDLATKAWIQQELGADVPTMYAPEVTLDAADVAILQAFYNISLNRHYAHPKNHMLVPSSLAPIKMWFGQFLYQHMVPYLDYLLSTDDRNAIEQMLGMEMAKRNPLAVYRITCATLNKRNQMLAGATSAEASL